MRHAGLVLLCATCTLVWLCTPENPLEHTPALLSPVQMGAEILFRNGKALVAPDSVSWLVVTVTYDRTSVVDTVDFSKHSSEFTAIPTQVPFTVRVEGLDSRSVVVFRGEISCAGASKDTVVTVTADQLTPLSPSGVRFENVNVTEVVVRWVDNSSNEFGFVVERRLAVDSTFTIVDTTLTGGTGRTDTGLVPASVYYYRVCAYNGAGASDYSAAVPARTLARPVSDTMPPYLQLAATADTTVSDSLLVTGVAYDESGILSVTVHGRLGVLASDSTFRAKIPLVLGVNTVRVEVRDNSPVANVTAASFTVVYDPFGDDRIGPVIAVTSHNFGDTVGSLRLALAGTVSDEGQVASMAVADNAVIPSQYGDWNAEVILDVLGLNAIVLRAIDGRGNVTVDTFSLFVDTALVDTVPPLIVLGIDADHLFRVDTPTVSVGVTDKGSGVDSVVVGGRTATLVGTEWTAMPKFKPDTNWLVVWALDNAGNESQDSVRVLLNRVPEVVRVPATRTLHVGADYVDTVVAGDADGNTLLYLKVAGPVGLSVDPSTGRIQWRADSVAAFTCAVRVVDKYDDSDTAAWMIDVVDATTPNSAPTYTSTAVSMRDTAYVEFEFCDTLHARDAERNLLRFSFLDSSTGMVLVDSVLRWTPVLADTGRHTLSVRVDDGLGESDTLVWSVLVVDTLDHNVPPVFASMAASMRDSARVGWMYRDTVHAIDANGDPLVFTLLSPVAGQALKDSIFSWTPTVRDTGARSMSVVVFDGRDGRDTLAWAIAVRDTNHAPAFISLSRDLDSVAFVGVSYVDTAHATDPDRDVVNYACIDCPSGVVLLDSAVTWTPVQADTGRNDFALMVADGHGKSDTIFWSVLVYDTSTAAPGFDLSDGLVAWYPFDGDMKDKSSNAHDAQNNGAIPAPDRHGTAGKAYLFDGSDHAEIGNGIDLGGPYTSYTIVAWFKTASQADMTILSEYDHVGGVDGQYIAAHSKIKTGTFLFEIRHPDTASWVYASSTTLADGDWHQYVCVMDGKSELRLYVDGVFDGRREYDPSKDYRWHSLWRIGAMRWQGSLTTFFDGLIDDIRIYNRVLSNEEMDSLYREGGLEWRGTPPNADSGGIFARDSSTVVLYRCNNLGAADTVYDLSGHGNNGVLHGASWVSSPHGKALSFDGVDDYVDCGKPASVANLLSMTLEVWLRIDGWGGDNFGRVVGKDMWWLWVDGYSGRNRFEFSHLWAAGSTRWFTPVGSASLAQWHYVACVFTWTDSTAACTMYVDGTQQTTEMDGAQGGAWASDVASTLILGNSQGMDRAYEGLMDEVRISNVARTQAEIEDVWTSVGGSLP